MLLKIDTEHVNAAKYSDTASDKAKITFNPTANCNELVL